MDIYDFMLGLLNYYNKICIFLNCGLQIGYNKINTSMLVNVKQSIHLPT